MDTHVTTHSCFYPAASKRHDDDIAARHEGDKETQSATRLYGKGTALEKHAIKLHFGLAVEEGDTAIAEAAVLCIELDKVDAFPPSAGQRTEGRGARRYSPALWRRARAVIALRSL